MPPQRRGAFYGRDIAGNPKTLSQAHTEGARCMVRHTPGAPSNGTGAARGNPICARWRAGVRVCAGAGMGVRAGGRACVQAYV